MLHLSPETEALIRAKANEDGITPEELLRAMLQSDHASGPKRTPDLKRMKDIAARAARLPILDHRTEKEITDEGWEL